MSQIVKCEHSVALKKEWAIENLRLESSLKPDRLMKRDKKKPQCRQRRKSPKTNSSVGQGYDFRKQSPKVLPNTLHFCPSRRCESGAQKSQIHESKPPPVPDPPDPQDQKKKHLIGE